MPQTKPHRVTDAVPGDPDGRPIWFEFVCRQCLRSARGPDTAPAPRCLHCDVKMWADDPTTPPARHSRAAG